MRKKDELNLELLNRLWDVVERDFGLSPGSMSPRERSRMERAMERFADVVWGYDVD